MGLRTKFQEPPRLHVPGCQAAWRVAPCCLGPRGQTLCPSASCLTLKGRASGGARSRQCEPSTQSPQPHSKRTIFLLPSILARHAVVSRIRWNKLQAGVNGATGPSPNSMQSSCTIAARPELSSTGVFQLPDGLDAPGPVRIHNDAEDSSERASFVPS